MHINWPLRELNLKVVYYGPALSGKTTNLEQIYAKMDPSRRSEMVSIKTHEDRTLYFDFLQLELGRIGRLTPKIQLYTVPGQAYYEASRRLVLRGADGIVFVVDSDASRLADNLESWRSMLGHMRSLEINPDKIALVVQFNKQDLPTALSPTALRSLMRVSAYPCTLAVAFQGQGVLDTLKTITRGVMERVQRELA